MSSSFVRIPDDSGYSGPRIKTFTSTDGGNTVHQHAMVLVDQNGNPITPTAPSDTQPISGTVSVDNFPATQPVSIASSVPVTGPLTDTQLRASAVPVSAASLPLPSGASTEATLALIKAKTDNLDVALSTRTKPADSQHVTIDNASVAVTGTFFQATQPVSGPLTDTQLRASAVPVSNTNLDVALSTRLKPADTLTKVATVDTITNPVAVTGTFFQSTQPISATSLPLPSGAATSALQTQPGVDIGDVTINNTSGNPVPTTAADALVKGTQGATGFSVQPLRDAGRAIKTFTANGIASVTAEALATLQPQTDGTNGTTGTSFTVTSGKRLRLQHFVVTSRASAAAVARSTFFLRMNSSGAVTTASPIIVIAEVTGPAATAITGGQLAISLPDGIELSGTQQFGISHISPVTTHIENITLMGYEY